MNQVWVLGNVFGGFVHLDTLDNMISLSNNDLVPLVSDPTIPDTFLVKQDTKWRLEDDGLVTKVIKKLDLYPDGSGAMVDEFYVWSEDFLDLNLPNPRKYLRVDTYIDTIKYHIEIRENKEFIVFNKTGKKITLVYDELVSDEIKQTEINVNPGSQRESLLFNGRENVSFKFSPTDSTATITLVEE